MVLGLLAIVAAVILLVEAAKYVEAHLVLALTVLGFTVVMVIAVARPISAVLNGRLFRRFVVMSGEIEGGTRRRVRKLPEPVARDAAARPFTGAAPESTPALAAGTIWTPAPSPIPLPMCKGPGCTSFLPEDPDARWRAGSGMTTPRYDDGSAAPPVRIGEINEFCSEACTNEWLRVTANHARRG